MTAEPAVDRMAVTSAPRTQHAPWVRTVRAEWARLWTVRSSWGLLGLAALMMAGIGLLAAAGVDRQATERAEAWAASTTAIMPVQMVLLALAALAVTADYSSGGIVPALQWTPDRRLLFLSRAGVVITAVTVLGTLASLLPAVIAYSAAPDLLMLSPGAGAEAAATVAGVLACGAALAVGLGLVLRSTAGALVGTFLLMLVLPLFMLAPGNPVLAEAARFIPGSGAAYLLLDGGPPGTTTASAYAVLVAWGLVALGAGWFRLARDDAHG